MQYVGILKHYSIFAEYSDYTDNFQDLIIKVFIANKQNIEFYVIPYLSQYEIYFLHYGDYVFSAICHPNMNHETLLTYLQNLKDEFVSMISSERDQVTLKATNLIKKTLETHFASNSNDRFMKVEKEIEAVTKEKHSLLQNMIDKELRLDVEIENSNKLLRTVSQIIILVH